jgi:predicted Zn-dependent protease
VRQPEENAITLPGGYIDLLEGLLDKAATPDGLADVIAHEVGRVAHARGTKMVLQASGLSRLLDGFVRGGAVILTTKVVARIETTAGSAPTRALLDRTEWAALKNICAGA